MLLAADASRQADVIIRFQHWNRRLGKDRAGIELLGDQVNGATADGHARGQGLPDSIQTLEAGEQ